MEDIPIDAGDPGIGGAGGYTSGFSMSNNNTQNWDTYSNMVRNIFSMFGSSGGGGSPSEQGGYNQNSGGKDAYWRLNKNISGNADWERGYQGGVAGSVGGGGHETSMGHPGMGGSDNPPDGSRQPNPNLFWENFNI